SDSSHDLVAYGLVKNHQLELVLLNMERGFAPSVTVPVPAAVRAVSVQRLTAPSLESTSNVRYRGAAVPLSGRFTPRPAATLRAPGGTVQSPLPAASAALVTIPLPPKVRRPAGTTRRRAPRSGRRRATSTFPLLLCQGGCGHRLEQGGDELAFEAA